jgi:hypothetical protein
MALERESKATGALTTVRETLKVYDPYREADWPLLDLAVQELAVSGAVELPGGQAMLKAIDAKRAEQKVVKDQLTEFSIWNPGQSFEKFKNEDGVLDVPAITRSNISDRALGESRIAAMTAPEDVMVFRRIQSENGGRPLAESIILFDRHLVNKEKAERVRSFGVLPAETFDSMFMGKPKEGEIGPPPPLRIDVGNGVYYYNNSDAVENLYATPIPAERSAAAIEQLTKSNPLIRDSPLAREAAGATTVRGLISGYENALEESKKWASEEMEAILDVAKGDANLRASSPNNQGFDPTSPVGLAQPAGVPPGGQDGQDPVISQALEDKKKEPPRNTNNRRGGNTRQDPVPSDEADSTKY